VSGKWQRTFEVSVPVERLWRAFTEDPAKLRTPPEGAPPDPNRSVPLKMLEVQPLRLLRWEQQGGTLPEHMEFTVVFESTDRGSRFTVTRCGFGEGEDADVFSESNALGWTHGLMDLVLYLETGQVVQRHYYGANQSSSATTYRERDWGLEVLSVLPGGFGAEVGLQRGDRLLRIAGVPVYTRAEAWALLAEHAPGTELEVEFIRGGERRLGSGRLSSPALRAVGE
jgi:uncharacterized protein YndB with AHSA1/START domain